MDQVFCALFFINLMRSVSLSCAPDYYWRDLKDVVPKDAVVGGTDEDGKPTYIGQSFFSGHALLPTTIRNGSNVAIGTADGEEEKFLKHNKVLCTSDPARIKWVSTTINNMHLITGYQFIIGGVEVNTDLLICRVPYKNRLVTGKVFPKDLPYRGCEITLDGENVPNIPTYEVLGYSSEDLCCLT